LLTTEPLLDAAAVGRADLRGTTAVNGADCRRPAAPHGVAHKAPARGRASPLRRGEGRAGSRGTPCVIVAPKTWSRWASEA
jgi:hypothetical protein